jgi:hypothetical protein
VRKSDRITKDDVKLILEHINERPFLLHEVREDVLDTLEMTIWAELKERAEQRGETDD